jgi:hypothetical protein
MLSRKMCVCFAIVFAVVSATLADDQEQSVTITGWAVHGYAGGKQIGYGWYETREEAEMAKAEMEQVETTTGKYYDKVEVVAEERDVLKSRKDQPGSIEQVKTPLTRLKEAKDDYDRAKKIAQGDEPLLKAKQRKLGDTIKEYKDMVAQSYRQVTEAKKTLTGGVAALSAAKFKEVNALIDQYNREVSDFRSVMGKDASLGFDSMDPVQPPTAEQPEVVGSWSAGDNQWDFRADGTWQIADTRNHGNWKKTPDGIAVKYSGATVWMNLKWVGDTLVDEKGYIGHVQLKKTVG